MEAVLKEFEPAIHINVQIHISAEMDEEQIDAIFESMARNLKTLQKRDEVEEIDFEHS